MTAQRSWRLPRVPQRASPDGVTVIEAASGCLATKTHTWRNERWITEPYSAGRTFAASTIPVGDVHELSALLLDLERQPRAFVIRGQLTERRREAPRVARRYLEAHQRPPPDFEPANRRWLCIDLDDAPAPSWLLPADPASLRAAARWAIESYLPRSFHGAAVHYQWSSSAAVKPWSGLRLHLWFWLDRPACCPSLRAWLRRVPHVDAALYNPVQPHYTAAPVFVGASDPLEGQRSGFIDAPAAAVELPRRVVDLTTRRSLEAASAAKRAEKQARRAAELRAGRFAMPDATAAERYAHAALRNACARIAAALEGQRHATIFAQGAAVGELVGAAMLNEAEALAELGAAAAVALPPERDGEAQRTLRAALARGTLQPFDRSRLAQPKIQGESDAKDG